ncbi:hypothetical protein CON22_27980 [Bacillus cereus]|nr:hypothetical protein CON22_27980 [Bacillus cereus]
MRKFTYDLIENSAIKRKIHILEALNNGKSVVFTNNLAEQLQCSTRTISNDISQLKNELSENWDIVNVKTSGYILIKPMTESILPIINNYLIESVIYKIMLGIFNNRYYTLEKWSQLLFIEKSTLWRYIKKYKNILNINMLRINPRKVQLEGDEVHIRHYYIMFFYFTQKFTNKPLLPVNLGEKLEFFVIHNEININWHLLRSIIFVWINRFHNKHYITKNIKIKPIYTEDQLNYVNEIMITIENYYGIKIPKKEKDKISLELFVCSTTTGIQRELIIKYLEIYNPDLYKNYLNLIHILLTENNIPSKLNRKLEKELIGYFYKTIIYNELTISISYVYDPLKHAGNVLQNNQKNIALISSWNTQYNNSKFTKEEIEYIASSATIILNSVIKERNILLFSSGLSLEDHVIYTKLTQNLGGNTKIHTTFDRNIEYDFIISNFEIPDAKFPVISFTGMMTENEIDYIKNYIINLK